MTIKKLKVVSLLSLLLFVWLSYIFELRSVIPPWKWYYNNISPYFLYKVGNAKFNKGAIYNIGFNWSMAIGNYQCYIFHDVDLLSENDLNYYGCPTSPIHMSPAVDKLNYR